MIKLKPPKIKHIKPLNDNVKNMIVLLKPNTINKLHDGKVLNAYFNQPFEDEEERLRLEKSFKLSSKVFGISYSLIDVYAYLDYYEKVNKKDYSK